MCKSKFCLFDVLALSVSHLPSMLGMRLLTWLTPDRGWQAPPAQTCDGLSVSELGELLGVVECLHEYLGQLLFVLGLLVLLLPVLEQHVNLRDEESLCAHPHPRVSEGHV